MSIATEVIYDVFFSHADADAGVASFVKEAMSHYGLEVHSPEREILPTSVLVECGAVVILLTRATLGTERVPVTVGGAMAWDKPIYILYDGISPDEIPEYLRKHRVARVSGVARVAEEIAQSRRSFSQRERQSLIRAYENFGMPTDELMGDRHALHDLARKYNKSARSKASGEGLMQELVRMRKQGMLPSLNGN
jgi:hypothetical protein